MKSLFFLFASILPFFIFAGQNYLYEDTGLRLNLEYRDQKTGQIELKGYDLQIGYSDDFLNPIEPKFKGQYGIKLIADNIEHEIFVDAASISYLHAPLSYGDSNIIDSGNVDLVSLNVDHILNEVARKLSGDLENTKYLYSLSLVKIDFTKSIKMGKFGQIYATLKFDAALPTYSSGVEIGFKKGNWIIEYNIDSYVSGHYKLSYSDVKNSLVFKFNSTDNKWQLGFLLQKEKIKEGFSHTNTDCLSSGICGLNLEIDRKILFIKWKF
jgi:hypothetical protein